jgi:hypothetical protein
MRCVLAGLLVGCSGPLGLDDDDTDVDGGTVPDPPGASVRIGWPQVAVAPDGAAWVSWVEIDGPIVTGLFVARSPAPGAPLEPAFEVPVAEPPFVGSTEKPSLAVTDGRIAFAYTGFGPLRHGDAHGAYVQMGTISSDGQVAFEPAILVDSFPEANFVLEHARVAFDAEGELWALWKRQVYGLSDLSVWARESEGFAAVEVSEALSTTHDCSPPHFTFGPSGRARLAVRSNLAGFLETVLVSSDSGASAPEVVQVSDDTWPYSTQICPDHGPRVAEGPDGLVVAAWVAPLGDETVALKSAWSYDGGETFTAPALDHEPLGIAEAWVSLAATADGRTWMGVQTTSRETSLLVRTEPAGIPTIELLQTPDGETKLTSSEAASLGDRTVFVAEAEAGGLYLFER